jgi:hypothetical protein
MSFFAASPKPPKLFKAVEKRYFSCSVGFLISPCAGGRVHCSGAGDQHPDSVGGLLLVMPSCQSPSSLPLLVCAIVDKSVAPIPLTYFGLVRERAFVGLINHELDLNLRI